MNNYCKDIEVKIVDYTDGILDAPQKEMFLIHIKECEDCRRKFEEFLEATKYVNIIKSHSKSDDISKDILFEKVRNRVAKRRLFMRFAFATVMTLFVVISVFTYSHYLNNRLNEALNIEYNIEYFVDLEEEMINSDDETFEVLSAIIYGEEYKDFEAVLSETSIIKP